MLISVTAPQRSPARHRVVLGAATLALLAAIAGGCWWLYRRSLERPRLIPGIRLGAVELGAVQHDHLPAVLHAASAQLARQQFVLRWKKHELRVPLARFGARVDREATRALLVRIGKSGDVIDDLIDRAQARRGRLIVPLVLTVDRRRARRYFSALKRRIDRPARSARLDLEKQRVVPGRPGLRLRLYDALATVEAALRANRRSAALPIDVIQRDNKARAGLDISHVLGRFETVYSLADTARDRAHNLKVGAAKLDGYVLDPKERLSYNEVVGPRSREQGYRTAHIISQGELVDGMAGGSCQLSSTLFAASFFAGLDLESSRPHTIPSSYIKMGLDATVAYPTTDMVIANPYDFPVVIDFKVNRGKVRVRILGKKRPWKRVTFRREILEQTEFKEVVREDPGLPRGVRIVAQRGVPGFKLIRERLFFADGAKPAKRESRTLRYPPTTQIIKVGTGKPDPDFKRPRERPPFGDVKPELLVSQ